ncbi:MAG: riboflavin synthase [Flavobacteriales bacterium]|nr:MAG: riboflavin synthase [Flavobacteriales bacterium]
MFTGIVEEVATVHEVRRKGGNFDIVVSARMAHELKVDQSVAHNGVCLTVVEVNGAHYKVTAIEETLQRTNLGSLRSGDGVNLERCLRLGDRLDGHMVQGHVDTTVECTGRENRDGSWWFTFHLPEEKHLLVHKGSICVNGVSLTIADLTGEHFSVAIIPYTYAHTAFHALLPGMRVNLEFDILGKYVERMMASASPRPA